MIQTFSFKIPSFDSNQPSKTPPSVKNVLIKTPLIIFPYGFGLTTLTGFYSINPSTQCMCHSDPILFFLQQLKAAKLRCTQQASTSHHLRLSALRSAHQSHADGSNGRRICLRCESENSPSIEARGNKTST